MSATLDWSGASGDVWARRWHDTDRSLADVGSALDAAIDQCLPDGPFRALDVGCGPGTTTLALAAKRPDASIVGCDLSKSLIEIAQRRAEDAAGIAFVVKDAERAARERGPFELILSRHGVMFFEDPYRAFRTLRSAAARGGRLVFSCFQAWEANPWASELASAAAGSQQPSPGREPSGFAFADSDYVRDILHTSGWTEPNATALSFTYVAGTGESAVAEALGFFADLGPASRILQDLDAARRAAGLDRMREAVVRHKRGNRVEFPAAAWIWSASAA